MVVRVVAAQVVDVHRHLRGRRSLEELVHQSASIRRSARVNFTLRVTARPA
jgi:hypothetical protein